MKKKKEHHEEHVDETWLIPYADMLTLLLALFIVMFAMSQVDKQKLAEVSEQFNIIFSGGNGALEHGGTSAVPGKTAGETGIDGSTMEEDRLTDVKEHLEQEISNSGYSDKVKVELNGEGLEISIQDAVLFKSGDSEILKEVSPLLLQITKMLKNFDNHIRIEGHSDNVPIKNQKYNSNWELSSARAINVMNFMVGTGQMTPDKFSIQAYAEYKPKYSNDTEEGRSKNRRVEIFIARKYPVTEKKAK